MKAKPRKLWCDKCWKYTIQKPVDDRPLGDFQCPKCKTKESAISLVLRDPAMIELSEKIYRKCGTLKPEDYYERFTI